MLAARTHAAAALAGAALAVAIAAPAGASSAVAPAVHRSAAADGVCFAARCAADPRRGHHRRSRIVCLVIVRACRR